MVRLNVRGKNEFQVFLVAGAFLKTTVCRKIPGCVYFRSNKAFALKETYQDA